MQSKIFRFGLGEDHEIEKIMSEVRSCLVPDLGASLDEKTKYVTSSKKRKQNFVYSDKKQS